VAASREDPAWRGRCQAQAARRRPKAPQTPVAPRSPTEPRQRQQAAQPAQAAQHPEAAEDPAPAGHPRPRGPGSTQATNSAARPSPARPTAASRTHPRARDRHREGQGAAWGRATRPPSEAVRRTQKLPRGQAVHPTAAGHPGHPGQAGHRDHPVQADPRDFLGDQDAALRPATGGRPGTGDRHPARACRHHTQDRSECLLGCLCRSGGN